MATVDAAVATAIVVVAGLAVEAPTGAVLAAGVVAFLAVWAALFSLQRLNRGCCAIPAHAFPHHQTNPEPAEWYPGVHLGA